MNLQWETAPIPQSDKEAPVTLYDELTKLFDGIQRDNPDELAHLLNANHKVWSLSSEELKTFLERYDIREPNPAVEAAHRLNIQAQQMQDDREVLRERLEAQGTHNQAEIAKILDDEFGPDPSDNQTV